MQFVHRFLSQKYNYKPAFQANHALRRSNDYRSRLNLFVTISTRVYDLGGSSIFGGMQVLLHKGTVSSDAKTLLGHETPGR